MRIERHSAGSIALAPLLRLLTWMSPAFPIGGYSYSHGLEQAVEIGTVRNRGQLIAWVSGVLTFGSGRNDGLLLLEAYRAVAAGDIPRLIEAAIRAAALRGTAELALESHAQGAAFLKALRSGWPELAAADTFRALEETGAAPSYPVVFGVTAAGAGIEASIALSAFLHAFAAGLISAAMRLVPLGQTDGLMVLAGLEPLLCSIVDEFVTARFDDLGAATSIVDWTSMRHETQYTRLFRS